MPAWIPRELKKCPTCDISFEAEAKRIFCSVPCQKRNTGKKRREKTKNEFVKKSVARHGTKYDYSLSKVDGVLSTIEIICPEHGIFEQKVLNHLRGKGCLACAKDSCRKTKEQFIDEATKIHGDKYDYSMSVYVNYDTHLTIICPIHGAFQQSPMQHIGKANKAGCSECIKIIRVSNAEKEWLKHCEVPDGPKYRQVQIGKRNGNEKYLIVDGMSADGKTVYEFLGDYWHGNPAKYDSDSYNKSCKKSFGRLYEETNERLDALRRMGYEVVSIWESEWNEKK